MTDDNKKIVIERVFDAPKEQVWDAWTNPEKVERWWGPEGFWAPSIRMDFRVGGKYIFCMHGPKGSEFDRDMYSGGIYKKIVPHEKLVVTDYFSDEKGNKITPQEAGLEQPGFPEEQEVTVRFRDAGDGKTKLTIEYPKPENEEQFEAMKNSGMKDGWASTLEKLTRSLEEVN
ncbi:MAG: hypothetical protein UT84_C0003G0029 [Candidatus Curtissbacteria bacterium GW2011_GWA1_40_16]|uniref:Activator of Hsp90 ATPase homologue 1/2-like C-terminal domain-containing protein n=1 Tax=Candidatus Curtissbacteria bacterium GW2011_GWA1_40_16 TaxID=1618405 RepID=A0A0G0RE93_9BACT|nr:MAG: hypothetical protein UT84_C0003G0029 [Candidatus Curtissbacteria bacterium GW2011_GWA1_40_16]